ncbi:MAG: hypothetical protein S4CHLAM20_03160 [Chlamydiia bacterium]|nr:hypothetical protein [Chlamydiia bacterium]
MYTFQDIILKLQSFWASKGCLVQQNHDLQTGAGTFNPETFLRALGPEHYKVCNVEVSRRPTDGRYGENPNRLQRFHQFQVMMKPTPSDMQKLYLESLEAIGIDLSEHDIRFVHDDWESPTQGASGLGWEVWCDGMEVTQYTYFQQIGGIPLTEIPAELAYGIERLSLFLQKKDNIYDLNYNEHLTYGEVFLDSEKQYSAYNFDEASAEMWQRQFDDYEKESESALEKGLPIVAYDMAVSASHAFNMLDALGAISTTARVAMIHRVRKLCCKSAEGYLAQREKQGFKIHEEVKESVPIKEVTEMSKGHADFLLEIGSEHLPANAISGAMNSLESLFTNFFLEKEVSFGEINVYATQKRLAIEVHALDTFTKESVQEKKGPAINVAFDENGALTKQGAGFFRSCKLEISSKDQLEQIENLSIVEDRLVYQWTKEQIFVGKLLQDGLKDLILSIRFPKKMRWGKEGVLFARPIRSLVALLDKQVIDIEIEGIRSSNEVYVTEEQKESKISISKPTDYLAKLKKNKVLVSVVERRAFIDKQLSELTEKIEGSLVRREDVTNEVIYLSEYPQLAVGVFDEKFLHLPEELIVSEMIEHQRYYPLKESTGKISQSFIVAVDRTPTESIVNNNANVLRARLSDGLFLYDKDVKSSFDTWNEKLQHVTLHPKLGSIYNKVERISTLSEKLSKILGIEFESDAAKYCKADLASDVIYEFPELQGIMGKYYAHVFGKSDNVAVAIEESYMPIGEGGDIPTTENGMIVSLADKFDNLMSYIGIGLMPTSSKDPYALRRSAVGINRILIERKISFDLRAIVEDKNVLNFIIQRIKPILKEHGFSASDIEMCNVYDSYDPYNIFRCVEAIARTRHEADDFTRLLEVYKRVKGSLGEHQPAFSENLLQQDEERQLHTKLKDLQTFYHEHVKERRYKEAFEALTELVGPLELFFENVRVQVDDQKVKANRQALLAIPYDLISSTLQF